MTTLIQSFRKLVASLLPESLRILYTAWRKGIPVHEEKRRRWQRQAYWDFTRSERERMLLAAANFCFLNRPINGYYMEFGCFTAWTFRKAYDVFSPIFPLWHFIGFDSFEGFPEIAGIDKQEIWQKGKDSMGEEDFLKTVKAHGVPREKFSTVRGFYSDSLTKELQQKLLPTKAAVVYIDCDLYESTKDVFAFLPPFLQEGTVIIFDEWNAYIADNERGERKAFGEFQTQNPSYSFEPLWNNHMQSMFVCRSVTRSSC